jgi:hypothetical protein
VARALYVRFGAVALGTAFCLAYNFRCGKINRAHFLRTWAVQRLLRPVERHGGGSGAPLAEGVAGSGAGVHTGLRFRGAGAGAPSPGRSSLLSSFVPTGPSFSCVSSTGEAAGGGGGGAVAAPAVLSGNPVAPLKDSEAEALLSGKGGGGGALATARRILSGNRFVLGLVVYYALVVAVFRP